MEAPNSVSVTVEAYGNDPDDFRWHLTDALGRSVRVSPQSYPSPEEASAAGEAALLAIGAALQA